VVTPSIGVFLPENESARSATEGDCSGDCIATWLTFADASSMRGGRRGVEASPSSRSKLSLLALAISMGATERLSSLPSNKLFVGVGGVVGTCDASIPWKMELDNDDDLVDAARDAAGSLWSLNAKVAVLSCLRKRHFRENDGNLVPSRMAMAEKGDSPARRFLKRGLAPVSPSLKKPSFRS